MRGLHVLMGISFYSRILKEVSDMLWKLNEHPSRCAIFQTQSMVYSSLSDRPGVLQIMSAVFLHVIQIIGDFSGPSACYTQCRSPTYRKPMVYLASPQSGIGGSKLAVAL